jgi:hypothetical protein
MKVRLTRSEKVGGRVIGHAVDQGVELDDRAVGLEAGEADLGRAAAVQVDVEQGQAEAAAVGAGDLGRGGRKIGAAGHRQNG